MHNESEYPIFDANAMKILRYRYITDDEEPEDMFWRVANHIASEEQDKDLWACRFFHMMRSLDFLPSSPILFNAGTELGQLASCFVLPIEDNMKSIMDTLYKTAIIQQGGGGTGFSFNGLREAGAPVRTTQGVASGAVSFMSLYNHLTRVIKQGGKRWGANMGVLRYDHPEINEFIFCKNGNDSFSNFNISVALDDKFFDAVEKDEDIDLVGFNNKLVDTVSARSIFDDIATCAWSSGEPGVLFIDTINEDHPIEGTVEATNPCGEAPLLPHESCVLGSINLANFVKDKVFLREKIHEVVKYAVRFLDNVIDLNRYLFEEIGEATKHTRKIGLGVMGFADMLIKLGIPYDSEEALALAQEVMHTINIAAANASNELAIDRGTYPAFRERKYKTKTVMRNAVRTTIAPTGSISLIAMVNSGIEPFYSIDTWRMLGTGELLKIKNKHIREIAKEQGFYREDLEEELDKKGSVQHLHYVPEDVKRLFRNAHEIHPVNHVDMLAVFQSATDNAVSKTVNMPEEATVENVKSIIKQAYKLGCKGLTIYRDKSRDTQILNTGGETCDLGGECQTCD